MHASYVLPLRWNEAQSLEEQTEYLRNLARSIDEVIVVDGSAPQIFERHAEAWGDFVRHLPPDPARACLYGKVAGVLTGLDEASHDRVVIADDDVRYDPATLATTIAALEHAEVVRPQNYFDPLPWHARWDTARSLLNRACGADFPGTLGVRRSFLLAQGGYDGDVLFENLELLRTVEAGGGRVASPLDLFVPRLPCDASHFVSQRVRQAYDDFALPGRMALFLSLLPALVLLPHRARFAGGVAVMSIALAEIGRKRGGGTEVFPKTSALWAPAWVAERSVTTWLAVLTRLRHGGVRYAGTTISRTASSPRALRRRRSAP